MTVKIKVPDKTDDVEGWRHYCAEVAAKEGLVKEVLDVYDSLVCRKYMSAMEAASHALYEWDI